MRIQGVSIALAVGLGVLVAAGPVRAQQPDYEAAREHYKQAQLALDRGEFAVAAREFGIAYEITRDPVLFFKIAFAYEKAGDCDAALIYYRRYLKEGKPEDKDRTEAEARVAACEGKAGPATPPEPPPGGDTPPTPPPGGDDPAPGGTVLAPDLAGDPPGPGPLTHRRRDRT